MAGNKKQPYNWTKVKPGDIISFRYKSKSTNQVNVHSVLVLNPKLPVTLKDGTRTQHLIGIKLEESNKISLRLTMSKIAILEDLGEFEKIDEVNNLYTLRIDKRLLLNNVMGVKKRVYDIIADDPDVKDNYRTYDWKIAKNSAVYLESIRMFTNEY